MHVATMLLLVGAVLGVGAYIIAKRLLATIALIGDTLVAKFYRKRGKS